MANRFQCGFEAFTVQLSVHHFHACSRTRRQDEHDLRQEKFVAFASYSFSEMYRKGVPLTRRSLLAARCTHQPYPAQCLLSYETSFAGRRNLHIVDGGRRRHLVGARVNFIPPPRSATESGLNKTFPPSSFSQFLFSRLLNEFNYGWVAACHRFE
jgi:hypothetical protein